MKQLPLKQLLKISTVISKDRSMCTPYRILKLIPLMQTLIFLYKKKKWPAFFFHFSFVLTKSPNHLLIMTFYTQLVCYALKG